VGALGLGAVQAAVSKSARVMITIRMTGSVGVWGQGL